MQRSLPAGRVWVQSVRDRKLDSDFGEECDGTDLGGLRCEDLTGTAGTLGCTADCRLDLSGCVLSGTCGNGRLDAGEECDGTDLGSATCATVRGGIYGGGELSCREDCTFDTSGCVPAAHCGNGKLEPEFGEECDGTDLGSETCVGHGYGGGELSCKPECTLDFSGCIAGGTCGNGTAEADEECDGTDLKGASCESLGFRSGELGCTPRCAYDVSGCDLCGNGVVDSPDEECDGLDLAGQTCESLGYSTGILGCNTVTCRYITDYCETVCGDGVAGAGEECDGPDLKGHICGEYLAGLSGEPTCDASCQVNWQPCLDQIWPDTVFTKAVGRFDWNGEYDIWIHRADGSIEQLTHTGDSYRPTWSHDRQRIAYFRHRGGNELWLMDPDGSNQRKVTDPNELWQQGVAPSDDCYLRYIAWGPGDAYLVVSVADRRNHDYVTYLRIDPATGEATGFFGYSAVDSGMDFSPDGTTFLYARQNSNYWSPTYHICEATIVNDAADPTTVSCFAATQEGHADRDPVYGSIGQYVYYWSSDNSRGYDPPHNIYRLDRTTGQKEKLTFTTDTSTSYAGMVGPRPTRDGQWILFHYQRSAPWAIMAMRPDGSDVVVLYEDPLNDCLQPWP